MDDAAKAKIRKRAKIVITIADLIVLAYLVVSVVFALLIAHAPAAYMDLKLLNAKSELLCTFWDYDLQKSRDVGYFLPPDCECDYANWAERIHEHMQLPVAVFIHECGQTRWLLKPAELALAEDSLIARLAALDTMNGGDTIGSITRRYIGYFGKEDSLDRRGYVFSRAGDHRKWGIYYRLFDNWPPFCDLLKTAEKGILNPRPDLLVRRVERFLNLSAQSRWPAEPTLRAHYGDSLIYRSPMLDTIATLHADTIGSLRLEFYSNINDRVYRHLLSSTSIPWWRFAVLMMVLGVFHACWLWIKSLTQPDMASQ
ncbi:hypothetical protein EHM69_01100 [candidate division KSB1 bacterium]|nr:MAG: hypothetical protein EHM69_01100 [candidate division KSB1 bacterium]